MTEIFIEPSWANNKNNRRRDGDIIEADPNTGYPTKTAGVVPVESILLGAEATRTQRQAQERQLQLQQRGYCCDKLRQAMSEDFIVQDSYPNGRYLMRDLRTADIVF